MLLFEQLIKYLCLGNVSVIGGGIYLGGQYYYYKVLGLASFTMLTEDALTPSKGNCFVGGGEGGGMGVPFV